MAMDAQGPVAVIAPSFVLLPCPSCPAAVRFQGDLPMLPQGIMWRCAACSGWMLVAFVRMQAVQVQAFKVNLHDQPKPAVRA